MAMYRTTADVCWIQPLKECCNIYFMRGPELTDSEQILEGSSDQFRFAKVGSLDDIETLPLRAWLRESVSLNEATTSNAMSFDEVIEKLRTICLVLPDTKETLTWGKPLFRFFFSRVQQPNGPLRCDQAITSHEQAFDFIPVIEFAGVD